MFKKTHSSSIMAFPRHTDYACAVDYYPEPLSHKVARFVFIMILACGLVALALDYFDVLTK